MAVNNKEKPHNRYGCFLSRLCGGESDVDIDAAIDDFLSRLCGGEYLDS